MTKRFILSMPFKDATPKAQTTPFTWGLPVNCPAASPSECQASARRWAFLRSSLRNAFPAPPQIFKLRNTKNKQNTTMLRINQRTFWIRRANQRLEGAGPGSSSTRQASVQKPLGPHRERKGFICKTNYENHSLTRESRKTLCALLRSV